MTPLWTEVKRCDPRARALADRHYSRQTPGSAEFMPPGNTLVLLGDRAVWGSSRNVYQGRIRLRCSIFRNEGPEQSSVLIARATAATYRRWPERLQTEVMVNRVRQKRHPGYAFRCAGWVTVSSRRSKVRGGGQLVVLLAPPPAAIDERGDLL